LHQRRLILDQKTPLSAISSFQKDGVLASVELKIFVVNPPDLTALQKKGLAMRNIAESFNYTFGEKLGMDRYLRWKDRAMYEGWKSPAIRATDGSESLESSD
jgi:hypothetical protein